MLLYEHARRKRILRIIVLNIAVIRCRWIRVFFRERSAELRPVQKREIQVIRPARMPGNDFYLSVPCTEILFQLFERPDSQAVVFRKRA